MIAEQLYGGHGARHRSLGVSGLRTKELFIAGFFQVGGIKPEMAVVTISSIMQMVEGIGS